MAGSEAKTENYPSSQKKVLTVIDYAVTLAPWAGYIFFTHVLGSWKFGFIIGGCISAVIVGVEVVKKQSRFMDLGTLVFCVVMSTMALINAKSILATYNLPLAIAFIGVLASISLLIKSPFTYRCHCDHLPKDVVESSETNDVIYKHHVAATSVWAISEVIAGGISALLILNHHSGIAVMCQIIGTIIPMGYTQMIHQKIHFHPIVAAHPAMAQLKV